MLKLMMFYKIKKHRVIMHLSQNKIVLLSRIADYMLVIKFIGFVLLAGIMQIWLIKPIKTIFPGT